MGLGGYLAARSEHESYVSERAREEREIDEKRDAEIGEVRDVFQKYGLNGDALEAATTAILFRGQNLVNPMWDGSLTVTRETEQSAPVGWFFDDCTPEPTLPRPPVRHPPPTHQVGCPTSGRPGRPRSSGH
ncbi:VIT1/CCC1 transporter family protein (plasmid) [Deinococcus radiomollis]